ncbi:MAG: sensor histidine kinase [Paracoccaceae bacterium]
MTGALSLRLRLTAIILLPLLLVAGVAGLWQLDNARRTAADVFDRSLLSAALAVANDVAISGGDALSPETRDILSSTSGGPVFYHVYAPDGVIVAGYATPPVGIPLARNEAAVPTYFDAIYQGRDVSGVRLQTQTEIEGFTGIFTTTVWQDQSVRAAFLRDLVMRSVVVITGLMTALALIVWFGVRYGLRPLTDLEDAIAARSSDELSPIRRAVPPEVNGVVTTLNRLFAQVSRSMDAQSAFIANAAHQLRTPISGVLSLAEAVAHAPDAKAAKARARDLLSATQHVSDLGQKLLMLERAEALSPASEKARLHLEDLLPDWIDDMTARAPTSVHVTLDMTPPLPPLHGDATMLREALVNLVNNAIQHGGTDLSAIEIAAKPVRGAVLLTVTDDGIGIPEADRDRAKERFARLSETSSSGLGLSIAQAIVSAHEGSFTLTSGTPSGLRAEISLPGITKGG